MLVPYGTVTEPCPPRIIKQLDISMTRVAGFTSQRVSLEGKGGVILDQNQKTAWEPACCCINPLLRRARWLRLEVTFSWLSRSQIPSFSSTLTKGILHSLTIVWELGWNVVVLITALFLRGYTTSVFFSPTDCCKLWLWLINLQIRSSIWTNSKC